MAVAWMGLIFYFSTLPGPDGYSGGSKLLETSIVTWLGELSSVIIHAVLFGVLAGFVQAAIWGWKADFRLRWSLVAVTVASMYGISDEFHQSFVAGRAATVTDVLVDCLGASVAVTFIWFAATGVFRRQDKAKSGPGS